MKKNNASKIYNQQKRRTTDDKIFDNTYNKGEVDYDGFGAVEIDKKFSSTNLEDYYNSHEYYRHSTLVKEIFKIYEASQWYKKVDLVSKNKNKPAKIFLARIYTEIYTEFNKQDNTYTESEIFVAIGESLNISYEMLWSVLPSGYKIMIYNEMEIKYNKIQKDSYHQLF